MDTAVMPDTSVQDDSVVTALRSELSELRERYAQLEREHDALGQWKHRAVNDMATVSTALIREANDRGWCSEYDDIVASLNGNLHVLQLTERLRQFHRQVTVDMTFRVTRELTIEARTVEEADDIITDDLYGYMADAVSSYDTPDSIDVVDIRQC